MCMTPEMIKQNNDYMKYVKLVGWGQNQAFHCLDGDKFPFVFDSNQNHLINQFDNTYMIGFYHENPMTKTHTNQNLLRPIKKDLNLQNKDIHLLLLILSSLIYTTL